MNPSTKNNQSQLLLLVSVFVLILGVRLHLIDLLSYITPYYDDWRAGAYMRLYKIGEMTFDRFFDHFNGHIALWSNLSNFLFFDLNQQQWDPRLNMLVNAVIWSATGTLLVKIALSHVREINAAALIIIILILWLFPFSLLNALWGVQTHNYLMILFSVAAIWLTTTRLWTMPWCAGVILALAAPFTMGGGAFVSMSIFTFTVIKVILDADNRKALLPTLIASFLMMLFSVWMLYFLSGGHDFYYAKSAGDFFTTLFKTLSFPLSGKMAPSIVLLLPVLILAVRAIQNADLNDRLVSFTLTLFIYVLAIAIAIGYARGADGKSPSVRYFEFLELYIIVSAIALLMIQKANYLIKPVLNTTLVCLWIVVMAVGVDKHIIHLSDTIAKRAKVKPAEEDVVRRYLNSRDVEVFKQIPLSKLPFAGPYGLQSFIRNIEPLNMLPFELQFQPELINTVDSQAFAKNATIRVSKNKLGVKYKHESVIGSYVTKQGGMESTGKFISQVIDKTDRPFLMIPVMGYLGYKGLTLKLVDEVTGAERLVTPNRRGSANAEIWREIFIESPEHAFRLVAIDTNPELWFGFAAPRTVGRLSMMTLAIVENGKRFWQLGLFILLFLQRKRLANLLKPLNANASL